MDAFDITREENGLLKKIKNREENNQEPICVFIYGRFHRTCGVVKCSRNSNMGKCTDILNRKECDAEKRDPI